MIALFFLFLTLSVSPFKSKSRLEAENAALRHQLIVLQRRVRGREPDSCNAAIGASVTNKCVALGVRLRPRKSKHEARFAFDDGHWPLLLHAARDAKYDGRPPVQVHAMMEI
jgi:hypothetical protein